MQTGSPILKPQRQTETRRLGLDIAILASAVWI